MSNRVLIFGVNGFVGVYLVRELVEHGYEVFGADLSNLCSLSEIMGYYTCDLMNSAEVSKLVSELKPAYIVNLAAISSVGRSWRVPALTMRVNVEGALNILEAARHLDVSPRVLLVGSSEEYAPKDTPLCEDDPIASNNPYGISKSTQEQFAVLYAKRYGLGVCFTRSFNHTGLGQNPDFVLPGWCKQVAVIERSGMPGKLRVGNIEASRDFSDVRDVVRAYRLILEGGRSGEAYNVGSGRSLPLSDLLGTVTGFSCQPIEVEVDPSLLRPTDTPYICCDSSKLTRELGWVPLYDIEETLRRMFESYLAFE